MLIVMLTTLSVQISATSIRPVLVESLDLDGDGIVDFEVRKGLSYGPDLPPNPFACFRPLGVEGNGLRGLRANRVLLATHTDCFGALDSVAPGAWIGPILQPHQSWGLNGDTYSIAFSWNGIHETNGPLAKATNALVGIQFTTPRGTHYGWMEVASQGLGEPPKITRFAAEGAPNTPIQAGAAASTPFSTPLIPLTVPPSGLLIGGISIDNSTNTSTGQIQRFVELQLTDEVECVIDQGRPEWPKATYPASLVERTLLPNPLRPEWAWKKSSDRLRLYARTEKSDGTLLEHSGPLASAESVLIGIRRPQRETWWVEFNRAGTVTYLSFSPASSPKLLVGHPSISAPVVDAKYLDINHDGFIDFVESTTAPSSDDKQITLHPLRGQKILTPSTVNRYGTQIGVEPPPNSSWSTNSLTLMDLGTGTGSLGNRFTFYRSVGVPSGTNGYIAVQFTEGSNSHVGWIQYNQYEIFFGVMGMTRLVSPFLDFFDHGYQRTPGTPALIGADSSVPLTVDIQNEGENLLLRWDPLRRNSTRLEISTSLIAPAWSQAVSQGIDTFRYPKPKTPGPLFFRLQPVDPKPPVYVP